ncbi:MAG: aminomethyl-transferring glycine dehydrogenase subunit GcvPA [Planctomycetota bacterium]
MPFIQNTDSDQAEMLKVIGLNGLEELFDGIPQSIRFKGDLNLPEGLSEMEVRERIATLGARNQPLQGKPFFLGAGIYHHFIPALVDQLAGRSEFVTAYTPYQPELSQGALQAFFEYQTVICMLTGLDISNASMYDGASSLAEAALMAVDGTRRKQILVSQAVHPEYRRVLQTYLRHLDVEIVEIPFKEGTTDLEAAGAKISDQTAALILQNPNFFGAIEDLERAASLAHEHEAFSIASVDPIALSVIKSPGEAGADIATGEGQGLGVPMSYGGPGFGFLAARKDWVRRLPGRIVGQTKDQAGKPAYVLTFQTREQHIRRERATSNICTNHALMAIRGVIYLNALGRTGFTRLGEMVLARSHAAAERISELDGYAPAFEAPFFKEFVVRCPVPAAQINAALEARGIIGGYDLGRNYPGMEKSMLFCVTEMTSESHMDQLVEALKEIQG